MVAACSESDSTCLMVCSHDNECLLRMLKIELICSLDSLVKTDGSNDHRHSLVRMCSPVDLATLAHDEERLLIAEEIYAGLYHFSKCCLGFRLVTCRIIILRLYSSVIFL